MKSQRRHELKHNALDAELSKLLGFFRKHGNRILWGVLIVAIIVLVVLYVRNRSTREEQSVVDRYDALHQSEMSTEERIKGFEDLASQDTNKRIAALSCLSAADIYAFRAMLAESPEDRLQARQQAERLYRRAASDFPGQKLAVARAHLGLAKQAEDRGDWKTARAEYEAAQGVEGISMYPVAFAARTGEASLSRVSSPSRLATIVPSTAPASAPASQTTSQPASEPASGPATVPAG